MDLKQIEFIKRTSLIALVSDDDLMERLVLKGGNAINLILQDSARASWDLDFSIEGDFSEDELIIVERKIRKCLINTFAENGYHVFDIKFREMPEKISPEMKSFWGGYVIDFKLIKREKFANYKNDIEALRKNAEIVASGQRTKFQIEISKHEFCRYKAQQEIDYYKFFIYTPVMIVIEKLRAICQQMPDYLKIVKKSHGAPRAKDFFDIYLLMTNFNINLSDTTNSLLLKKMFAVKKVPLDLLKSIKKYRDFHSIGFIAVQDTVLPGYDLKDFDFYYNYVINLVQEIKVP